MAPRRKNTPKQEPITKDISNISALANESSFIVPNPSTPSVPELTANTSSNVDKVNFKWTVDNFSSYYRLEGAPSANINSERIKSPTFSPPSNLKLKFYLSIFPKSDRQEFSDYVGLFLSSNELNDSSGRIEYALSILKDNGEKWNKFSAFNKFGSTRGWSKFIPKKILFDQESELLPDNKLTIYCEITAYTEEFCIFSCSSDQTSKALEYAEVKLAKDLETMLINPKHSDISLRVGPKEFAVHKNIFASRSPVFAAMFQHDLRETRQNQVTIIDIEVEVFEDLLRFIYTGKVNPHRISFDLLVAADKYQLDSLKSICEFSLSNSLQVESVVKIFMLSDMHCAHILKAKCIDFINNNSTQVISTDGWKQLCTDRPELLALLYHDFSNAFGTKKRKPNRTLN